MSLASPIQLPDARDHGAAAGAGYATVVCLAKGTLVAAEGGAVPAEALRPGCRIWSSSAGPRPVLYRARRSCRPRTDAGPDDVRPVRITAGALGPGLPRRDLVLDARHRLRIPAPFHRTRRGVRHEIVVSARRLAELPGIRDGNACAATEFVVLGLDAPCLVSAEGLMVEAFPGKQ